jgi:hypothetical protein
MRVFISHSWSEKGFADSLLAALLREGFSVWNPDRELLPGDNWLLEAGRALERADAVVFVLSPESVDCPSSRREIQYVTAQAKFEHRVFPVRVGEGVQKVPWVLRDLVIDAPDADAESVASEIAKRLRPAKPSLKPAALTRRVRSAASSSVTSKVAKAPKREPKRARRSVPNG